MASFRSLNTTNRNVCLKCDGAKSTGNLFTCSGCQQKFCCRHVAEHQQDLAFKLDSIVQEHDLIQEESNEIENVRSIEKRIDQWEQRAIQIIRDTAKQIRLDAVKLQERTKDHIQHECSLLAKDLKTARENETYTEINLEEWKDKLNDIRKSLDSIKNISIIEDDKAPIPWIRLEETTRVFFKTTREPDLESESESELEVPETLQDQPINWVPENRTNYRQLPRNTVKNPQNPQCKQQ